MKMEPEFKDLVEEGKRKGFLTYEEVNRLLPEDVVSGDKIDSVFSMLEEMGIELADDDEEPETPTRPAADSEDAEGEEAPDAEQEEKAEAEREQLRLFLEGPGTEKIDDPVRMYLTQMGEIPLLTRDQEIRLAKLIELTRKRYRKKVLESGLAQD
ncbi:MAG: RNA polymerase sigma factor region1.1 domain-containing protein, partial [Planctomycetota bacterium]